VAAIETRVTLASKAGQAEYTQPYIYTAGVVRKLFMTRLFQWHTGRLVETELYGVIVGPTAGRASNSPPKICHACTTHCTR
jgi:hypothetical protein